MHHKCINFDGVARECKGCEKNRSGDIFNGYLKQLVKYVKADLSNLRRLKRMNIPAYLTALDIKKVWDEQEGLCKETNRKMTTSHCSLYASRCLEPDNADIRLINPLAGLVPGNVELVCSSEAERLFGIYMNLPAWDKQKLTPRSATANAQPYQSISKSKSKGKPSPNADSSLARPRRHQTRSVVAGSKESSSESLQKGTIKKETKTPKLPESSEEDSSKEDNSNDGASKDSSNDSASKDNSNDSVSGASEDSSNDNTPEDNMSESESSEQYCVIVSKSHKETKQEGKAVKHERLGTNIEHERLKAEIKLENAKRITAIQAGHLANIGKAMEHGKLEEYMSIMSQMMNPMFHTALPKTHSKSSTKISVKTQSKSKSRK